ncbi:fucose-specific lectin [Xylariaceae sp. FL0594]|nr:fucose-specific lectin [Xylariaceae sp. FL0594]
MAPLALNGSAVAATATGNRICKVYFQDAEGGIRERAWAHGWHVTPAPIFTAKLWTPLAAISWDGGNQVRVYSLTDDDCLQEWCFINGNWSSGYLTKSKYKVSPDSKLAAVYWQDGGAHIRLYCQEPSSNQIQEFVNGNPWKRGSRLPEAVPGTGISAVGWQAGGTIHLRVYYQAPDLTLREHCWERGWSNGNFITKPQPFRTPIAAAAAADDSGTKIRVFYQFQDGGVVEDSYDNGAWRSWTASVVKPLRAGVSVSALQYGGMNAVRVYYQANDLLMREMCQDAGRVVYFQGNFVVE